MKNNEYYNKSHVYSYRAALLKHSSPEVREFAGVYRPRKVMRSTVKF